MDSDLLRQRRNLMMISGGLLLFDFANVTVAKVSILGTELLIGNVKVLIYCAWFLWGYFLLRYYQYLRAESDLGISTSFRSLLEGKAKAYLFQKLGKEHFRGYFSFTRSGLRLKYSMMEYQTNIGTDLEIEKGVLPLLKTAWWYAKSWFHIAAHTPKVTDHILPFLLAAAAPLSSLISA